MYDSNHLKPGLPFRLSIGLIAYAILLLLVLTFITLVSPKVTAMEKETASPQTREAIQQLLSTDPFVRLKAIDHFAKRGKRDAIPLLVQHLRFSQSERPKLVATLNQLAGLEGARQLGDRWFDWMAWQQKHPEIKPVNGFVRYKVDLMARIDTNFRLFLYPGVAHEIRLEEIAWGGVRKDGIPSLNNPKLIPANRASYLTPDELVFGITINSDVRAYPLRIMDWHEMFNDVIGGVPVALAYCTLCGSGILYDTRIEGQKDPIIFGTSGFLYRSNKLMYDPGTHSLWNQFQGRPVVGKLTGSGIKLKTLPLVITSWQDWLERHPNTKVLSLETGYDRIYKPGFPYGTYFASPDLMFPAPHDDKRLAAKDFVFVLRGDTGQKAWPVAGFTNRPVINDTAGILEVTLIGDSKTRTVRAYRTKGETFETGKDKRQLNLNGETWQITETALLGPGDKKYFRLPGHIAYWFAWSGNAGEGG